MEILFILLFWLPLCIAVSILAERYNRSGLGWFFFSVLLSPLLGFIFVLVCGPKPAANKARVQRNENIAGVVACFLVFGLGFFAIVSAGRSEPAAVQKLDDEKIIVMIVMIALPNGDSGVHVKPFATAETCIEAANIEITDPYVRSIECAELEDGRLILRFERGKPQTLGLGVVRHFDENGKYIGSTSASPVYQGLK